VLPGLVEDTEDTYVLSNVQGQLLDCHRSTGIEQLDQHVSFLVLRDFHGVVFVLSVFVHEETKFFVHILAFIVGVDVSINKLLDSEFVIVERIVFG